MLTPIYAHFFEIFESRRVKKRYYSDPEFQKKDRYLLSLYKKRSPYFISAQHARREGYQNLHTYGETPLTTLEHIAKSCNLTPEDTLLECGAGRGRSALFFRHFFRCKVLAVEEIPQFVQLAKQYQSVFPDPHLTWLKGDFTKASLDSVTMIYLAGTCIEPHLLEKFRKRLLEEKYHGRILSVSEPLEGFSIQKKIPLHFPWGKTLGFLH